MASMPSEAGAPTLEGMIPLCVPEIRGNEWKYVKECLDTNWVSSAGGFVDRFEQMLADYVGVKYGVATVNGTSALHVALLTAGVQADDEVLVSTLSFIAPANAIRYTGAWPVFIDAEPLYWQMDPEKVATFLERECRRESGRLVNVVTGRRVKAILPVHILGHPCDMEPIAELGRKYDLVVIEDASESLGARYGEMMVGRLGDIACFSFNGNKLITTGGGGMVVTDNEAWAERARYLTTQATDDPVEYIHSEIGFNYRLTNLQAAMGVAQLESIDEFVAKKREIASTYGEAFGGLEEITPMPAQPRTEPSYWLYTVLLDHNVDRRQRNEVIGALSSRGVSARPLFHPIHGLPPYAECQAIRIEHSVSLYERGVCLPSSVGLKEMEQQRCIDSLVEAVNRSS